MSPLPVVAALLALALSASASASAGGADAVTPERHKQAIAANTAGLRFYKAGQLPRAAMRFRDATALDRGYALAHYNLACVASRLREVATAVAELTWLGSSEDPVAKAKLVKASSDADLDFVSALPKVREILGLAPLDPRKPLAWLSERHGTWSVELPTRECPVRSYAFAVRPDGALTLTVREACDRKPLLTHTFDGAVTVAADGAVHLDVHEWPLWPSGVRLTFAACPGLTDAPGSCFTLASDDAEIGPFHRGVPGQSPMRARPSAVADAASVR
jgi:hypothetical protein